MVSHFLRPAPPPPACRYYYSHNSGLQAQNVLYSQSSLDSEPVLFFDPNTLSADGTVRGPAARCPGLPAGPQLTHPCACTLHSPTRSSHLHRARPEPHIRRQVSLGRSSFSEDGALWAYQISSGGSDWVTINLLRVDATSGATTQLEDVLHHVKFSGIAWTHDNKVPPPPPLGTISSTAALLECTIERRHAPAGQPSVPGSATPPAMQLS